MDIKRDQLIAGSLSRDPRLSEAKNLLIQAVADHQKKITGIRPPHDDLKHSYQEIVQAFSHQRGNPLYYPYIGSGIGKGAFVELLDGSIKYDFISGIGVHYLGHSHPEMTAAIFDAAASDIVMQGHLQQNWDSLELSKKLTEVSGLDHCFLASSGAMANENALKLAFQNRFPAQRILSFEKCFTGRTLTLSQITDKPAFREGLPLTLQVDYVPFFDQKNPEESTALAVAVLKKHLNRYPKQHAMMCFELVQGEGGFNVGTRAYFVALMEILRQHQIPIIIDEVQTFGRTPRLFAFQHFQLEDYADIVTIGKVSHVCATLFKKELQPRPGLLSQTFTSSTAAIRATYAMVDHLLKGHYFGPDGKIIKLHQHFAKRLQNLEDQYPNLIQGPFGIGTMIAFTPLGGDPAKAARFAQQLFDAGVISFVAGAQPTRIRFLVPAGVVSEQDIDAVASIIEKTLKDSQQ